jgi:hypothetical protein
MGKSKADLQSIQKEVKPFLCKECFQKVYIDSDDVALVLK